MHSEVSMGIAVCTSFYSNE